MTAPSAPNSTASVFDALRIRLGLEVRHQRPGDPFPWGTEKVRPRRDALEAGLAATRRKIKAEVRGFRRRMRALTLECERYHINLAEVDAFVQEKLVRQEGPQDVDVPHTVASKRRRPASGRDTASREVSAAAKWIEDEANTTEAGNAIEGRLPVAVVDPGQSEADDVALLGDENANEGPDAGYALDDSIDTLLHPIEACTPGWSDVDNAPGEVRESLPFAGRHIDRPDALTDDEAPKLVDWLPPEDHFALYADDDNLARSAVKPLAVAPEATAPEADLAKGIEPFVVERAKVLLQAGVAGEAVISKAEIVSEPDPIIERKHPEMVVAKQHMELLAAMYPQDPMNLSELNERELLAHSMDKPVPVSGYPDIFADEQLAELDVAADLSLLPREYDMTWADHWPEDPNEFQKEMYEEFPHFGFPAMPYARSLTREEAKEWFEGMTEHQARHWLGSIIFPSPHGGLAVSPKGQWHSRENTVTETRWEIATQNYGCSARAAALSYYLEIEEIRLPEARRQLFWQDVIHRRRTIKNLMRQVTWGVLTVEQLRQEVFRTDHDLMIAMGSEDVKLYCAQMVDKLPWPPGLSRIELAAEFGGWPADHFQDMSPWWRPPYTHLHRPEPRSHRC